jgi:hypothetical protein
VAPSGHAFCAFELQKYLPMVNMRTLPPSTP